MKFKSITGGQASRVEVYGLFIAATVLLGGGIGGAYAITTSMSENENASSAELITPGEPSPSESQPNVEDVVPASPTRDDEEPTRGLIKSPVVAAPLSPPGPVPEVVAVEPPSEPPLAAVDPKFQEPYIGPANTFAYLSAQHICGWDTQALGGFGWGYDPASPCNDRFVAYIGQHCEAADGVVYSQRCDEYFSQSLPVAY
jgi:hypothetical protein